MPQVSQSCTQRSQRQKHERNNCLQGVGWPFETSTADICRYGMNIISDMNNGAPLRTIVAHSLRVSAWLAGGSSIFQHIPTYSSIFQHIPAIAGVEGWIDWNLCLDERGFVAKVLQRSSGQSHLLKIILNLYREI